MLSPDLYVGISWAKRSWLLLVVLA